MHRGRGQNYETLCGYWSLGSRDVLQYPFDDNTNVHAVK